MIDPSHVNERAIAYATIRGLELKEALGFGKDGVVYSTTAGTAIKIFNILEAYNRELECYQRLREMNVHVIAGHHVPRLKHWDDNIHVLEISIVDRPFLLDFASAYLDIPPDFPPEVIEEWERTKQEEFGRHWPQVRAILSTLENQYGIYLLDVHPGNIKFATDDGESE